MVAIRGTAARAAVLMFAIGYVACPLSLVAAVLVLAAHARWRP